MQTLELKGEIRKDLGKKATKQVRKNEMVPCVIYGSEQPIHFAAHENEFKNLVYSPNVYLVNLNLDGKIYTAIMKDIQFHPVSDKILHVDFYFTSEDKPVIIEIPVKLHGFAEGVKAGGKLQLDIRKLRVKALPKYLPDSLDIQIDDLGLGKTIKVSQLNFENLDILNAANAVVVSVRLTRAARAAQQKA